MLIETEHTKLNELAAWFGVRHPKAIRVTIVITNEDRLVTIESKNAADKRDYQMKTICGEVA